MLAIVKALAKKYDINFYIETGLNIDGEDEIVPIGYFTLDEIEKVYLLLPTDSFSGPSLVRTAYLVSSTTAFNSIVSISVENLNVKASTQDSKAKVSISGAEGLIAEETKIFTNFYTIRSRIRIKTDIPIRNT